MRTIAQDFDYWDNVCAEPTLVDNVIPIGFDEEPTIELDLHACGCEKPECVCGAVGGEGSPDL